MKMKINKGREEQRQHRCKVGTSERRLED